MSPEEIFGQLIAHMLEGMMTHEQLANYFDFLALKGYRRCHEYHYLEETKDHRDIQGYYISHYGRLLPDPRLNITEIIPQSWYSHVRQDVDRATKQEAVQNGLQRWRSWEYETKRLYQSLYGALLSIGEMAAAEKVGGLVADVDEELAEAEQMYLEALSVGFDLTVIMPDQKEKYKEYSKKLKDIDF